MNVFEQSFPMKTRKRLKILLYWVNLSKSNNQDKETQDFDQIIATQRRKLITYSSFRQAFRLFLLKFSLRTNKALGFKIF